MRRTKDAQGRTAWPEGTALYVVELAEPCDECDMTPRCEGCLGDGRRLDLATALRLCSRCGCPIVDHNNSLGCRVCKSECGIDCRGYRR